MLQLASSEDIDHFQNVSVSISWSLDMHWYGVWNSLFMKDHQEYIQCDRRKYGDIELMYWDRLMRNFSQTTMPLLSYQIMALSCTDLMSLLINLFSEQDMNM